LLRNNEIRKLAEIVPDDDLGRLKLPIVIIRRMELGKSVYTVAGGRVEEATLRRILDMTDLDHKDLTSERDTTFLYRPQITELLRKFHTA
jgi:uncharacterized protein (UPF0216 family)